MGFFKRLFESRQDNFERVGNLFKEERNMLLLDNIRVGQVMGLEKNELYTIGLFEDRIRMVGAVGTVYNDEKDVRNIFRKDIQRIRIMDTKQIEEQSKLGQMMFIGVLALGTKKQTKEVFERRIVLDLNEDGIEFSVIMDTDDSRYNILELAKKLNKWKDNGAWERIS